MNQKTTKQQKNFVLYLLRSSPRFLVAVNLIFYNASCNRSEKKGFYQSGENAPIVKDLSWCCENGDLDGVKAWVNTININGLDNTPPLHLAANGGHLNVIDFLISQGADINKIDSSLGSLNRSPVHVAISSGHTEIVAYFVRMGAKIDIPDNDGHYPIHTAASIGNLDVVKVLLDAGAKPDQRTASPYSDELRMGAAAQFGYDASDQFEPIHSAAKYNQPEVVKFFMSLGISPDTKDGRGVDVFRYAVKGTFRRPPEWATGGRGFDVFNYPVSGGWSEERASLIRIFDKDGSFERTSKECISTDGYYVTEVKMPGNTLLTPVFVRFYAEELAVYSVSGRFFPTKQAVVSFGVLGDTTPAEISKWLSPRNEEAKKKEGFITGLYHLMGSEVFMDCNDSDYFIKFIRMDNQLKISIRTEQEEHFPNYSEPIIPDAVCKFVRLR